MKAVTFDEKLNVMSAKKILRSSVLVTKHLYELTLL